MSLNYGFYEIYNKIERNGNHIIDYRVEYKGEDVGYINASLEKDRYIGGKLTFKDKLLYSLDLKRCGYDRNKYRTLYEAKVAFIKKYDEYLKSNPMKAEKGVKPQYLTENYNGDFYPTPSKLAGIMLSGVKYKDGIKTVLEPSAGKGDLADCISGYYTDNHRNDKIDIDCIEKDENLQYILNGKGYKVVHDDFLTYGGIKKYDLILMNPPFSKGCEHLLKAIAIQKHGGQICCLLNAETLRNPYTNERKVLAEMLYKYHASVKFIKNSFRKAERKSCVDVAVIWININPNYGESVIYDGLKKADYQEEVQSDCISDIVPGGFVEDLIAHYNNECRLCKEFIREYNALKPYIINGTENYSKPFIEIKISGSDFNSLNDCIEAIRLKYWNMLLNNSKLTSKFTYELQKKYAGMIQNMKDFDFSMFNIKKIIARMNAEMIGGIEEEIYKIFDKLSAMHSYGSEINKNIHYFNGWKTNKAWKVGMKAIVPAYGVFSSYGWSRDTFNVHEAYSNIADVEKCLNYLNGKPSAEVDALNQLENANAAGVTRKIQLKYFNVTYYKKGTVHIEFHKDFEYLIDALNIFVCKSKGWLPPSYGKKSYNDMTEEEKEVINDFQGEEKYNEVLRNKELYVYTANNRGMLMLDAV